MQQSCLFQSFKPIISYQTCLPSGMVVRIYKRPFNNTLSEVACSSVCTSSKAVTLLGLTIAKVILRTPATSAYGTLTARVPLLSNTLKSVTEV